MELKDSLIFSIGIILLCIIILLIACVVVICKVSFPDVKIMDALSGLSSIFTIVGTVATITALGIAYFAFKNQIVSNEYSISSSTLNALLANANSVRNALNLTFYERSDQQNQLEYGVRAVSAFLSDFRIPSDDQGMPPLQDQIDKQNNFSAQDFIAEILFQLEIIVDIISDLNSRRSYLKDVDYKQVDSTLRNLINYYFRKFAPVYNAVKSAMSNRKLEPNDWRLSTMEFHADKIERYELAVEKLVKLGYVVEVFAPYGTISAHKLYAEQMSRHSRLQDRISKFQQLHYYKSI